MSSTSWRSAEALQKRRRERRKLDQTDDRERLRRQRGAEEWHITGEPAFRPKARTYPNGGGVEGTAEFLGVAERVLHLHDRGKGLTEEMSAGLASLERKHEALSQACLAFQDKHTPHMHPPEQIKSGNWEVSVQELRLFAEAAGRMTSAQREAFTNVLAPVRDKSEGYIEPLEPLAARLLRAKNAPVEQAVSGALFGDGKSRGAGRFARAVRAAAPSSGAGTGIGTRARSEPGS